jgi:ADP-ribose pyrophosphatase YjhB (NUDIX family)
MEEPIYCPRCGAKLEKRLVGDRVRHVCPRCGYVFYLNPTVAAGTLVEMDGKVVLVRRGVQPGMGKWGLPSGYVEADESAEEAAARETMEEAGIEVEIDNLLGVYSFGEKDGNHGVLILYAAHVVGGELRAGDDAQEVRAFPPHELPEADLAFDTNRQALREWLRATRLTYKAANESEATQAEALERKHRGRESDFVSAVTTPDSDLIVALDEGDVVGFCKVQKDANTNSTIITRLFVTPNYRRWGIGSRLLQEAIGWAEKCHCDMVRAEAAATNPGMVVYLKSGFRVCGFLEHPLLEIEDRPDAFLHLCRQLNRTR